MANNNFIQLRINYNTKEVAKIVFYSDDTTRIDIKTTDPLENQKDINILYTLISTAIDTVLNRDYHTLHKDIQEILMRDGITVKNIRDINAIFFGDKIEELILSTSLEKFTMSVYLSRMIFIINGSGGVGKDTFIQMIVDNMTHGYINNYSAIEPVRNMYDSYMKDYFDVNDKNETVRKILADTSAMLNENYDIAVNYISKNLIIFLSDDTDNNRIDGDMISDIAFVHIREPKNIQKIVDKFGAYTILMTNKNVRHITSNESDKNVDDYNYDKIIENNGTLEELDEKAKRFMISCTETTNPIL